MQIPHVFYTSTFPVPFLSIVNRSTGAFGPEHAIAIICLVEFQSTDLIMHGKCISSKSVCGWKHHIMFIIHIIEIILCFKRLLSVVTYLFPLSRQSVPYVYPSIITSR
jgi:hypothetical protein